MAAKIPAGWARRFMLRMPDRTPIKDTTTGEPLWFQTKSQAKAYRDQTSGNLTVSHGPDHRKW